MDILMIDDAEAAFDERLRRLRGSTRFLQLLFRRGRQGRHGRVKQARPPLLEFGKPRIVIARLGIDQRPGQKALFMFQ